MSYAELNEKTRSAAESVLTRKQLDVFKLWCNGHTPVSMAGILGIHEATVRGHLRRALQKLYPYYSEEAA